ncbi:MAG: type II/IV secretion system protein, partial [Candidatus Syntrophonatronum acetioxidans]
KVLVEEGFLGEDTLLEAMEKQLGLPRINLQNLKVDPQVATLLPLEMARRYQVIPVAREGNLLSLAMVDPQNLAALDEVERVTGCQVNPFIAGEGTIERLTDQYFGIKESVEWAQKDNIFFNLPGNTTEGFKVREGMEDAPIIKVVNSIIQQAVSEGASDIHIDPYEDGLVVRLRIDGVLHDLMSTPKNTQPLIISRVKIAAGLDISERRLPQDGRMVFPLEGGDVNMRISTLPTVFGEKVVLRILDREKIVLPLENLGFSDYNYRLFLRFIKASTGMILVTGPTGCGKSTTLYSTLNHLSSREKNIITVEDPVEYYLEGINQVQVNGRIGYTFARALRTILRQDPNIVMIGEIRDL